MPDNDVTTDHANNSVTVDRPLVHANIKREKGAAIMTLDCRGLHAYLETIGVGIEGFDGLTESPPGSRNSYFDNYQNKVNARALCKVGTGPEKSILRYNLKDYWSAPLRTETLQNILATVNDALIEVLTHYQPVELSLTIRPRVAPTMTEPF